MRAFQLSLVGFILALGVVSAKDNLDETKAIEKIELLGGKVMRDETIPVSPVIGVDFAHGDNNRFNEKYLHLLKSFTSLKSLNLNGTKITDASVKEISQLKCLMEIGLYDTQISIASLNELKKSLPDARVYDNTSDESKAAERIESLGGELTRDESSLSRHVTGADLQNSRHFKVSDQNMQLLKPFKSLTSLNLGGARLADSGLNEISHFKNLVLLNLCNTDVTDTSLKELHRFNKLTNLNLAWTRITDEGLKELSELKNLTTLNLFSTAITDVGLRQISVLNGLTTLQLGRTQITDQGLREIRGLEHLTTLVLAETKISDVGLKQITALNNLKILHLGETQITDVGLWELANLTKLRTLDLTQTRTTYAGMKRLKDALPRLVIPKVDYNDVPVKSEF